MVMKIVHRLSSYLLVFELSFFHLTAFGEVKAIWPKGPEVESSQANLLKPADVITWLKIHGMREFCEENSKADIASQFFIMTESDLDAKLKASESDPNQIKTILQSENAWAVSMYPAELFRLYGVEHHDLLNRIIGFKSINEVRQFLVSRNSNLSPGNELIDFNDLLKYGGDQSVDINQTRLAIPALCATYGVMSASACTKSLHRIIDIMAPRGEYVLIDLTKQILSDHKYIAGAKLAAVRVLDLIYSKAPIVSNLFDTIRTAYQDSGLTAAESEDLAWNLLAVMGTHGPNTSMFLYKVKMPPASSPLIVAMSILSSGAAVLDQRSAGTGHPFSYPTQIRSICNYGKPYHFWMTAYLAREMTRAFGNLNGARTAAWLSNLGYQMRSSTAGRDPSRVFTLPSFDAYNNRMRIDLAFAAAGATFGSAAAFGKRPTLDIDGGIRTLILNSNAQPLLDPLQAWVQWSGTGLQGFRRWKKIISPDSVFELYAR